MEILNKAGGTSAQEMLEKIKKAGLLNEGLNRYPIYERFSKHSDGKIVAGLDNADTDHVFLEILKEDPERVFEGMTIAAELSGAQEKALYIPEDETQLLNPLTEVAEKYGVRLASGIIDARAERDSLPLHIVTAKRLSELLHGSYTSDIYVSVNGGKLRKISEKTIISDLLKEEGITGIKGILCGYVWRDAAFAEKTVAEAGLFNGVLYAAVSKDCIVQITKKKLLASRKASCGKCVFCREGLIQLEYMQNEITEGRGKSEFLDLTKEIGTAMCFSTSCSMGQTSAEIALSAIDQFAEEYEEHINKRRCPAGVCTAFVQIYIDPSACTGCGDCMDVCPKDCIEGRSGYIHMIDTFDCSKCGKCISACEEGAVVKTAGKVPKLPDRLTKVGRFRKH